jgi:hypothetical protein
MSDETDLIFTFDKSLVNTIDFIDRTANAP